MSSLRNHRKQEESSKASSNFTGKKKAPLPLGRGRDPLASVLPQQLRREDPLASREKETSAYLPVFPTSSSKHGRQLTIKKKGWSFSKFQNLTREVWSSPRVSKGKEKPSTSSSETGRKLTPSLSW